MICVALTAGCPRQVGHANVAFDVSSDGKRIVFSSAGGDLFLLNLDTQKVRALTNSSARETSPAFSPDNQSIVYAADTENSKGTFLFARSIYGRHVYQLTEDADVCDSLPQYSPDGSQIAFARAHRHRPYSMGGWTWDDWDVYVMDAAGGNLRRVTHKKHYGINKVLFSRDGQAILFSAETDRGASDSVVSVFEASLDGGAPPTVVTSRPKSFGKHYAWASNPGLSRDGRYLVLVSDRQTPYHYDLVLMDRQTGDSRSLAITQISRYNQGPLFAPDGKQVLFLAGTKWNADSRPIFSLWSVDTDGKNPIQIADSALFTDPLKWLPKP